MANDADIIDSNYVYALHTFVANVEGQVCVMKGDNLKLLDDTNYYWWLVKCVKTEEIGYIPAENIETPSERLARLNKFRNIQETLVNSQDAAEPPATVDPSKPRLVFADSAIVFENYDDIDYDDDYEDEEAVVEDGGGVSGAGVAAGASATSSAAASASSKTSVQDPAAGTSVAGSDESGKSSKRSSMNMNINTGFLKKLWTKDKSPTATSPSTSSKVPASTGPAEPKKLINILRIYTGNVDLKATYKAVALTQDMTTSALLDLALKRFRVENEPANNYFLSVLFMDSGEKPLDSNAIVFTALEALKNKNLPGVANFTRIDGKERAANVMMNDDNIIKVIINKKLNIFEKNYHLMRVYRFDESDGAAGARTYKTIGVSSGAMIEEITEIVRDKFKVVQDPAVKHFLCTKVKGENTEKRRTPDEKIVDILATPDGTPIELEFIFRHEPASPETFRKRKLLADKTPKIATGDSTTQAASGMDAILSGALPFLDGGDSRSPAISEAVSPNGENGAGDEESDRQSSVSRPDSDYSARGSVTDEGCETPQAGSSRSRAQSTQSQNYVLESQQKSAKRGASDKISSGTESGGKNQSTSNESTKAWLPSA